MTIGVLGGGQLGRMLALAGVPLGLSFRFLDPSADSPAAEVGELIVGEFKHAPTLRRFAKGLDAITYEFENVPVACVERLVSLGASSGCGVFPNAMSLRTAQDRLLEKQLFGRVGLRVPAYAAVDSQEELDAAVERIGLPAVLKTRRMGYDGKGQKVLRTRGDVEGAVAQLAPGFGSAAVTKTRSAKAGLILEQFVKFDREVSIIAVRSRSGEFRAYPLTENQHSEGILRVSRALVGERGRGEDASITKQAQKHAKRIMRELDYVGVLAIEFFVRDGELLGNEMAPRVHNSGHWTIDGAVTSQFENHVRAILGLPLGSCAARGECVMINLIGELPPLEGMLEIEGAKVHLYGKEPRPGRKIGHVTCVGADGKGVEAAVRRVGRVMGE